MEIRGSLCKTTKSFESIHFVMSQTPSTSSSQICHTSVTQNNAAAAKHLGCSTKQRPHFSTITEYLSTGQAWTSNMATSPAVTGWSTDRNPCSSLTSLWSHAGIPVPFNRHLRSITVCRLSRFPSRATCFARSPWRSSHAMPKASIV